MRCKILMQLLFCTVVLFVLGSFSLFMRETKKNPCASNSFGARVYNFLMNSSLSGEKSKYFSTL